MTFEEKMAQAFKETFDERSERLMKVEKKHRFSLAYRLWERKTIRDLRRNRRDEHWTLKRARYIVAAMTVAISLSIGGTAYAAVVMIGRYGFEDKIEYSKLLIENHPSDKTSFEEYYGLPEEDDWELTNSYIGKSFTLLNYERGDIKIRFVQEIINNGTMGNISTDRAEIEPLSLYEENDGFVLDFGNDDTLLCWIYDGYLFILSGNMHKTELINLAYSTKTVDLQKKF